MAKGYIVLDMPKSCRHIKGDEDGCPFGGTECRVNPLDLQDVMEHVANGTKPEWCPIQPDVITNSLAELINDYGDNGTFFVKGKEIYAKDLLKELEDNTEIGHEFRKNVTKTIVSYFMKFG